MHPRDMNIKCTRLKIGNRYSSTNIYKCIRIHLIYKQAPKNLCVFHCKVFQYRCYELYFLNALFDDKKVSADKLVIDVYQKYVIIVQLNHCQSIALMHWL